ncbi:AAA family ATPase [Pseudobutyrivibrio xylanivorans]|uniref:ATPase domain-containing protein n=1 Tax=Pseudobutyrivibrio xylanivorans DSM 14809 TaxID=1123012 RepID=A0A1M6D4S3_PSEXY|nr:ATP-binding protein [Pseudobutyrivibrio xylanivorans]SHI68084.1 hypothetical protein SAMN02745725_00849 [Pseudobutyrivibrio xylanivorans DSM 14809]
MIIGREKEINVFHKAMSDDKPHFIAVYGRRRIGKTFLIREAFNYRFTFQHAGLSKGTLGDQIFAFQASIKDAGGKPNEKCKNWLEAFEDLKDLIRASQEKKKIIFIDELSWMDTQNSDLLVALEHFWNGWASARNDIILIVCASATSWMLSNIIHNKGGLYHRLTEEISLPSFSLSECELFIKEKGLALTRNQILQYYMIFGGVPFYWTFLEKGLSLSQNIDNILFAENAPLRDEFEYLYASIFRHPEMYIKIVEALGKKKVGMTREEIIKAAKLRNSGELTKKLEELESCGFIRKYYAFGMKKKNAVYQLIDNFTLFYYQFMELEPTDEHFWSHQINTPSINTWLGLAFERVCLEHINQIKQKLGISGVKTDINSWYTKEDKELGINGSQIDLLIVRNDQVINLCEMKYSNTEYTIIEKDDKSIKNKISDLVIGTKTKFAIYPTIITTYGLVNNSYAGEIQSVVTMDDMFAN